MLAASASVPFARAQAQGRGRRGGGRGTECCGGGRTGQWSAHGVCTLSWRGAAACWHAMLAQMHACVLCCIASCPRSSLPCARRSASARACPPRWMWGRRGVVGWRGREGWTAAWGWGQMALLEGQMALLVAEMALLVADSRQLPLLRARPRVSSWCLCVSEGASQA